MPKFYVVFFLLLSPVLRAQTTEAALINRILKAKPTELEKYAPKAKQGVLLFRTGFNDAVFENPDALNALSDNVITKVELVYTTYRKSETFDQHTLNRKRLQAFFRLVPNALTQPGIEWVLRAQTGCTSPGQGKEFFHGVVIYFRHEADEKLKEAELSFLKEVSAGTASAGSYDAFVKSKLSESEDSDSTSKNVKQPQFRGGETAKARYFSSELKKPFGGDVAGGKTINVEFIIDKNGKPKNISYPDERHPSIFTDELTEFIKDMPDWIPATENGRPVESVVTFSVNYPERGSAIPSEMKVATAPTGPRSEVKPDFKSIKSSPEAANVMTSLKLINPAESGLVCDVTGSMARYNAQVVSFLTQQFARKERVFEYVAFFNDGDDKMDKRKKIGATGGIYTCKASSVELVMGQLEVAMKAGTGGDLPENNIEAVLKLLAEAPQCKRVTMIADNFATPRDMSLIAAVTVPLDIILCGNGPANEAYLDLVRATKGTLMYGGKIYRNFDAIDEGSTFQVGKHTYYLRKGKFIMKEE